MNAFGETGIGNPLFEAGLEFQNTFAKHNWPFCYIGGLAVLRWGEIRMTRDIDLCLLCGFGNEERYVKTLLDTYASRIPEAYQFAIENRVLLLFASNGVPVDVSLSGLPFEETMIRRATLFEFEKHCSLLTCSAEDLIVLKAFADRPKDWIDVEGIIVRQGSVLNETYIIDQLSPLCDLKEMPQIVQKLMKMFRE